MTQSATDDDIGMRREDDDVAVPVTEYTVLPAGTYPVEFIRYERKETAFGPSIRMEYRITSGPHADALVDELCSLKGGRGSKLKDRLTTLRGQPYKPGEVLRPRELFGRTAQAYLAVKKVMGDDGEFEVNRIGDLTATNASPQRPGAGSGAAPRPAPPAGQPRLAQGLEAQPPTPEDDDPGWDTMRPPPAGEGSER